MHKLFFISVFLYSLSLNGQGIQFMEGSWSEVLARAKEEKKEVFVDIYTTWCGPCKKLDATTFKNPDLGKYINENFIAYKIDRKFKLEDLKNPRP